jgi:hypothetical protein
MSPDQCYGYLILIVSRIGFGVMGMEFVRCDADSSRVCPVRCWKPVVSYHTQIYGPVHGTTTHENSTTMSLYGYGLAYYVVESSPDVPTGCAGKLRWQNH